MENWNRDEWQGRRKDQYEFSAKVVFYSVIPIFILGIISTFF
jgi:hypothetical protein